MKASIEIDKKYISTGYAEEKRTASRINQTSAVENCETSAVGRALAFCGFTNDQIASAEELSSALENQDVKIQKALKELNLVSHAGSFNQWLTNYKTFLGTLKEKSPIIYASFMEKYSTIKTNLKSKGIIQ